MVTRAFFCRRFLLRVTGSQSPSLGCRSTSVKTSNARLSASRRPCTGFGGRKAPALKPATTSARGIPGATLECSAAYVEAKTPFAAMRPSPKSWGDCPRTSSSHMSHAAPARTAPATRFRQLRQAFTCAMARRPRERLVGAATLAERPLRAPQRPRRANACLTRTGTCSRS